MPVAVLIAEKLPTNFFLENHECLFAVPPFERLKNEEKLCTRVCFTCFTFFVYHEKSGTTINLWIGRMLYQIESLSFVVRPTLRKFQKNLSV